MRSEELNSRFWRDMFSPNLTCFPLSSGEWRAELKQDPMPQARPGQPGCGSVGFIVDFTCLAQRRPTKRLELVLPMKVVTAEARASLKLAGNDIEDFLNSDENWASQWNLG
jgi:hypothetical protein